MNVMAAICNSFSGRRSFASLTRSPGLNERAPVEEAVVPELSSSKKSTARRLVTSSKGNGNRMNN